MTPHETAAALSEAQEWLNEHLVGLDVAADCEARIQASYAPEMAEFEALIGTRDTRPNDFLRKVRNCVEASTNERRFRTEAAHLRTLFAAILEQRHD